MMKHNAHHIISRLPSRADAANERSHRDEQRGEARSAIVESAEQRAREELAAAIRWLEQACALDSPPGAYVPSPRAVRAFTSAALLAAERARAERRRLARGGGR